MNRWTRRVLVSLAVLTVAGAAGAQMVRFRAFSAGNFTAHLTGGEEVPPVATRGTGQAALSVSDDRSEVRYKLLVANVKNMTQAHIHCGAAGVNGPVVVFLFGLVPDGETLNGILAQGSFTAENIIVRPDSAACPGGVADLEGLLAKMEAGMTYVNVHTLQYPGGEVRGQIRPPEE
jgi:hypothetical protein